MSIEYQLIYSLYDSWLYVDSFTDDFCAKALKQLEYCFSGHVHGRRKMLFAGVAYHVLDIQLV